MRNIPMPHWSKLLLQMWLGGGGANDKADI